MRTLFLCGAGNGEGVRLAHQVERTRPRFERIVLLDDDPVRLGTEKVGVPVVGGFDVLASADPLVDRVVNLVTRTTLGRERARQRIAAYGIPFASLVHPSVDLLGTSLDVPVDELDSREVTVYPQAWIGAECEFGAGSVALVGAVVGHGSHVGRGCVIAPNAVVNARVILGDHVYVGSNATVLPDVRIGDAATIAANTLVIDDVPADTTAIGVPAVLSSPAAAADDRPPLDPGALETAIAAVVCELLSLSDAPRAANFFDLGGTSVSAVKLSHHLRERFGLATHPLDVFAHPTVVALVDHYTGGRAHVSLPSMQAARDRGSMRRVPSRH